GAFVRLLHQSGSEHALEASVECAGAELERVIGLRGYVLHDAVPVTLLVGEGEEDVKHRRRERELFERRRRLGHKYIRYGYITRGGSLESRVTEGGGRVHRDGASGRADRGCDYGADGDDDHQDVNPGVVRADPRQKAGERARGKPCAGEPRGG